MTGPSPERSLRLDDRGGIDEDLLCRGCSYNLRGLQQTDACPECSTLVVRSARPDLLRFSDPAWLSRVATGMSLLVYSLIAGTAVNVVMSGSVGLLPMVGIPQSAWYAIWIPLAVAASLVTFAGVWFATTPEPGRPEPDATLTARRLARWCMVAQVAAGPLQVTAGGSGGSGGFATPGPGGIALTPGLVAVVIAGTLMALVALTGQMAGLVYLRRLGWRLPWPKLARRTRIVMWGYLSSQVARTLLGAAVIAALPGSARGRSGWAPWRPS